jgi:hypothetical protein
MTHLIKPLINYAGGGIQPGVAEENTVDRKAVERHDHVSANGKRQSYLVGSRTFRETTFRWQDSTQKTAWESFWTAVKGGQTFQYYDDDSIPIAGSSTIASTTLIAGSTSDSDAVVTTNMVLENTELTFDEEEVYGYWSVTLQMREAV